MLFFCVHSSAGCVTCNQVGRIDRKHKNHNIIEILNGSKKTIDVWIDELI